MTMTTRHSTAWHELLDDFIRTHEAAPFVWGVNDCCTFAADWVMVVRRVGDPIADVREFGATLAQLEPSQAAVRALRWLDEHGGLRALATERLGAPMPGPMAQSGDLALVEHGAARLSLGVCVGHHVAAPGPEGLQRVPLSSAIAAWRV